MRVKSLEMLNYACFRGRHTVHLDAKTYAVTAQRVDQPDRSNWCGKTTFLSLPRYALFGKHFRPTEDEVITHGEQESDVVLTTDTGVVISRYRTRGSSTKLEVRVPGRKVAKGDEAQLLLNEMVGMDAADFDNVCFFRQKRMSHFMTTKPSERMEIVSGWFQLDRLERCQENEQEQLRKLSEAVATYERRRQEVQQRLQELVREQLPLLTAPWKVGDVLAALQTQEVQAQEDLERAQGKLGRLQDDAEKLRRWQQDAYDADRYASVVARGQETRLELDKLPPMAELEQAVKDAEAAATDVEVELRAAVADVRQKRKLSTGEFDGHCPVAEMQCPVKDKLNTGLKRNLKLFQEAEKKVRAAEETDGGARERLAMARKLLERAQSLKQALAARREEAKGFWNAAQRIEKQGRPPSADEHSAELQQAHSAVAAVQMALQTAQQAQRKVQELCKDEQSTNKHLLDLQPQVDLCRTAANVFRQATRAIAKDTLEEIERGANQSLLSSGIDLQLRVQWDREAADGLATSCDACGAAFPASQRVKVCERCGEKRGPKLVKKLELVSTDVSGAADDLAGAVFQLSAGAWLRRARSAAWSCAFLDEPFGSLDTANRFALATHLTTMLHGQYGFDQSFIVAHHAHVMDALPARIEILNDSGDSCVKVVG